MYLIQLNQDTSKAARRDFPLHEQTADNSSAQAKQYLYTLLTKYKSPFTPHSPSSSLTVTTLRQQVTNLAHAASPSTDSERAFLEIEVFCSEYKSMLDYCAGSFPQEGNEPLSEKFESVRVMLQGPCSHCTALYKHECKILCSGKRCMVCRKH